MNIDDVTGIIGKESRSGIEKDEEVEGDSEFDLVSKLFEKTDSVRIWSFEGDRILPDC